MMDIEDVKYDIVNIIMTGHRKLHKEHTVYGFYEKNRYLNLYNSIIDENKKRGFVEISVSQAIYNIHHDIYDHPKCSVCGSLLYFLRFGVGYIRKCGCRYDRSNKTYHDKVKKSKLDYVPDFSVVYDEEDIKKFCCELKVSFISLYYNNIHRVHEIYSRTKYLPSQASINERIYNIANDIYEITVCECGLPRKWYSISYLKTCGDNKCKTLKSIQVNNGRTWEERHISGKKSAITRKARGGDWFTEDTIKKLSDSNKKYWNEHKREHTNKMIANGSYIKQSITMKKKIKAGEFTPCITNSWANSRCKISFNGVDKIYRSTWDAAFAILNPELLYEHTRIIYYSNKTNKNRVYITDFTDINNKVVYEIKPKCNINSKDFMDKYKSAIEWCNDNGYEYSLISEQWFSDNAYKIDYTLYDKKIYKGMRQFLC
jgi:hypothetical protein